MLIRIRRLAGSVVGAAFILLLSLSMLQLGEVTNPLSFFRGSPVVIEVGDEVQRWNTLTPAEVAASGIPISATPYVETGYGPLVTALAVRDAWDGGALSVPRSYLGGFQDVLFQENVGANASVVSTAADQIAPIYAALVATTFIADDPTRLLPAPLAEEPATQVTQTFDFDIYRLFNAAIEVETPDEETLQTFLEENQEIFQRPPTWAIDALILDVDTLAGRIAVTDDQVRQHFEANPDLFATAEAWDYRTLTFTTQLEANLFQAQVDQGTPLDEAIASSTALISGAELREASAFSEDDLALVQSLEVGDLQGPSPQEDGRITYSYLAAYQAPSTPRLGDVQDQARASLQQQLASERLSDTLIELQRTARGEGLSLQEIADLEGYEVQSFPGLQSAATAPDPLRIEGLFARLDLLREPRPEPSRFTLLPGSQEMLFTVTSFEAQRPQVLEEVRASVAEFWRQTQAREANLARAEQFSQVIRSGTDPQSAIAALNDETLTAQRLEGVSRLSLNTANEDLGLNARFIAGLDGAASGRLIGRGLTQIEQSALQTNPRIISPFTLADGDIMIVDVVLGQAVIRATHRAADPDLEVREALVETLVNPPAALLLTRALPSLLVEDIASDRPATVDQDAIDAQVLAQQQALAQAASHGG